MFNEALKKGFSFGLTSGIITTLGLIVGLHSGTNSKLAVIGGILTIAIADAFSDALGIHVSEEAENVHSAKEIWEATIATFIAKFVFALTFLAPILLLSLESAIWASIAWGLSMLSLLSYKMAVANKEKPIGVVGEHLFIAILVIILTHFAGETIASLFG